ncbi:hypothetical protein [Rhodococcus sp. PvP104]|uniref:hypothetical protein n=1 Tax=Rhodococcus sp. PvP104 TaxID=2817911 RepID=UPI001AE3444D|nr:hypothetical protein [Rhodococcus sp. PvP104]MBP2522278.1 transposase [Rhodococcus sp. PvP104]
MKRVTDDMLRIVANIYRTAAENGQAPTVSVQEELDIPRGTAASWIGRARSAGYLAQDVPIRNMKVAAVADEIGVSYDVLYAAIRKHTTNGLRVTS